MKFSEQKIPGVFVIEPHVFGDDRGSFFECYNGKEFARHGITTNFVQDNHSISQKGILRGLHFQVAPKAQAKLVRVTQGSAFDVSVDLRKDSKTFGQHLIVTLSAQNKNMLYVPAGFAHGFCALEDQTVFLYKASDFYSPKDERGIIWNDATLAIKWPKLDCAFILSDRDQKFPNFQEYILAEKGTGRGQSPGT